MMSSLTCSNPLRPQQRKRFDQPVDVLVRLDVARVEDERRRELEPLADAIDVFRRRRFFEALVERVVDHLDLGGRHAQIVNDVVFRRVRHRQHPSRSPRRQPHDGPGVDERGAVRQVLRKPQMNAVVDRDDVRAPHQRRDDVVRRVKEIDARSPHRNRHAQLFANGIVARAFRDRREPLDRGRG